METVLGVTPDLLLASTFYLLYHNGVIKIIIAFLVDDNPLKDRPAYRS